MKKQLLTQDAQGWTVAVLAARAGRVSILNAILEEIVRSGVSFCRGVFFRRLISSVVCSLSETQAVHALKTVMTIPV